MLGISLLSEIAFTASLKSGAFKVPGFEDDVKRLWRHSLASGAYAKEVARMRRVNVESAYLCGLLHAIGKPVILRTATTLAQERRISLEKPVLYGWVEGYHTQVGLLIADKWGLPKQVAAAIQYSEDYDHATAFRQECLLTCVADRLASHLLTPDEVSEETLREHPVFGELNLYPQDIDQLIKIKEQVLTIVNAMNL
jgi:putative nucleotidyltransferase with HDIG domain